ncbi:hypothetical protein [Moorena producens]|uniref:hypothetical protein n=1 Tax=Moorena producens TaxID=1155739 RepID=UPI003C715089
MLWGKYVEGWLKVDPLPKCYTRLLAEVGNREQGTGNSGQELMQTLSENYFCKRSTQPTLVRKPRPNNLQH